MFELEERARTTRDFIDLLDRVIEANPRGCDPVLRRRAQALSYLATVERAIDAFFEDEWDEIVHYLKADGMTGRAS